MTLRNKIGIFISVCAVIGIALFGLTEKESYSTEAVMDSLWDKHDVQSTMIGQTDSVLDVSVYDGEDINNVRNYLESNLSKEDLKHYELHVYEWSSDLVQLNESPQENLASNKD